MTRVGDSGPGQGEAATAGEDTFHGTTDESGMVSRLPAQADEARIDARHLAQQIAANISVPRPRVRRRSTRGVEEMRTVTYAGNSDDIDVDQSLEVLAIDPDLESHDLMVREWRRRPRRWILMIDVSGSMKGERILVAAAAIAALIRELAQDHLAIVAFWADAAILSSFDEPTDQSEILELLLRVPARGLTNVSFALDTAARLLVGTPKVESRVLLLSDCLHNAGADPRSSSNLLPRLDVLVDTSGDHDLQLARDLARTGRGEVRRVADHRQIAGALSELLDEL